MEIKELLSHTQKLNVLFVEDDDEARSEIALILKRFFNKVIVAVDGNDGVEKFKNNDVDLIMTDINMPKLNGLDMLKQIKSINPDIYSIILSAYNETEHFVSAILMGVNGFMLKPFVLEQFINTITRIYKNLELQQEMKNIQCLLSQYQQIVDKAMIVCKFDKNKKITYTNDEFYSTFQYENIEDKLFDELFYQEDLNKIYSTIENKEIWQGVLKTISTKNKIFHSKLILKPILNNKNEIIEFIALFLDVGDIIEPKQLLLDRIDYSDNILVGILYLVDYNDLRNYFGEKVVREINVELETILIKNSPKEIENIYNLNDGKFAFVINLDNENKNDVIEKLKFYQQTINKLNISIDNFIYNISTLLSISQGEDILENSYIGIETLFNKNEIFIDATNLSSEVRKKAENNLNIINLLKKSISENKIVSFHQAIIDNQTQEVDKYESLVRIIDGDKIYLPYQFLDIAKHSLYYSKITKIVIENAFEVIKNNNVCISVNISENDINKENIRDLIFNLLEEYKEYCHKLTFEILEDENSANLEILNDFIQKVRKYKVLIAIDDFGSGYSNFTRLFTIKPDILKLDGSLIKNIDNDKYSYNLVKSMVDFAKTNKIKTIAEFVENETIFNIIKELGIEYSQGYYFDKPKQIF